MCVDDASRPSHEASFPSVCQWGNSHAYILIFSALNGNEEWKIVNLLSGVTVFCGKA